MKSMKSKTSSTQKFKKEKKMSKKLSKCIAAVDYIDKTLTVLSAISAVVFIISFTSVIGAPAGIASASFTLVFSLTTGIIKKLLSTTRNKENKHDKIIMIVKIKSNSIETVMSQVLIDLEIRDEEFRTTVKEKERYEKMKEDIRMIKSNEKLNENNKSIRENRRNA